ncbi:hypothetical protein BO70DRAFT_135371 [Aspergillus heteromorphus CBS 117.55]|uniref:TLC domain-containing protein n=1 Tax=Aspergillus heteromorphus CBS 117.55 TaxID=1448321 RepID=A0A317WVQ4_9EURO|nr:uncharacterized protein BO70DRAFT_135371 [Aspergillus heteromorphus CBS 117.55]PWY90165.1 hypothetical protein BO70DRAFT_135371 [Aspergillus heteromorphus CBS 117.55]
MESVPPPFHFILSSFLFSLLFLLSAYGLDWNGIVDYSTPLHFTSLTSYLYLYVISYLYFTLDTLVTLTLYSLHLIPPAPGVRLIALHCLASHHTHYTTSHRIASKYGAVVSWCRGAAMLRERLPPSDRNRKVE